MIFPAINLHLYMSFPSSKAHEKSWNLIYLENFQRVSNGIPQWSGG